MAVPVVTQSMGARRRAATDRFGQGSFLNHHRSSRRRSSSRGGALAGIAMVVALVIPQAAFGSSAAFAVPVSAGELMPAAPVAEASVPAAASVAGALPAAGAPVSAATSALQPTIQYEDALAHAGDPNRFAPGDRVTVPFRPRSGDRWLVGGRPATSLPAGRASGQSMAASAGRLPVTIDRRAPVSIAGPSAAPTATAATKATGATPMSAAPASATGAQSTATPAAKAVVGSGSSLRRDVFGFLPYWELTDSSARIDNSLLSTIAYFSVGVDKSGNLVKTNSDGSVSTGWGGWTSAQLTNVMNVAHQAGTRVVLTLTMFAWSSSDAATQGSFLGNASARAKLAKAAAAAVRDRGADGINLDFEPIASGHAADFTALVRSIRTELDALAPGYQLTFDSTAQPGSYELENLTAAGAADAAFVMAYDFRSDGAANAGSIAPLNGPLYDINDTVRTYLARVPASKIVLGLPYYGRAWSTVSNALNAKTQSGTKYGSSTSVFYATAAGLAASNIRNYDPVERSPWLAYQRQNCSSTYGCVTSWRELYYDDAQSLGERYDLVNRVGLRGVGMWALGYDGTRPELYKALADKFLNDTTPPEAGILPLPPSQSIEAFPVTWTAIDDWSGVAAYDVQVSVDGGAWADWQPATTATSAIYQGSAGHGYAFRVSATDGKGNVGPWDVQNVFVATPVLAPGGFARAQTDGINVRAAPDPAAQRVGGLSSGTLVAITGGPVNAGGYTWYQVTEPITEWNPVATVLAGVWVAAGSATTVFLAPVPAPNTTLVAGGAAPSPPTAAVLSLAAQPAAGVVDWGDSVVLHAKFAAKGAGRAVQFEVSRDNATWSAIGSPVADASGNATFSYRPSDNRYYRATFAGSPDLLPGASSVARVVVRQVNLLRPSTLGRVKAIGRGTAMSFESTVRPSRSDLPTARVEFVVYRLVSGHWTKVLDRVVEADSAGVARLGYTFSTPASYYLRSQALPTTFNANSGWSPIQRYDVR